jgi:terminal uridylyltransferase
VAGYYQQSQKQAGQLFNPHVQRGPPQHPQGRHHTVTAVYLDQLASAEVAKVSMTGEEREQKEAFRLRLEKMVHQVCDDDSQRLPKVALETFGSFKSGFATKGSDMDLVIVLPDDSAKDAQFGLLEDDLPRALEKKLLQLGIGARLLTRTRVPIIKICEKPGESLLEKLREERAKWDQLPDEKKYPHLHPENAEGEENDTADLAVAGATDGVDVTPVTPTVPALESSPLNRDNMDDNEFNAAPTETQPDHLPVDTVRAAGDTALAAAEASATSVMQTNGSQTSKDVATEHPRAPRPRPVRDRPFTRERKTGPLDFPKDGIGIQSDINFFNPLGLHNTQLLRCYSLCDPRVVPMILFVKSWAKRRKINSSYSGTLSSYGYVLMVLHYLINIAQPAVLPNLQSAWRPHQHCTPHGASRTECDGWTVDFWRDESQISSALEAGQMSSNTETLGSLLSGFFDYYSSLVRGSPQFFWTTEVLSLRTPGGILTKEQKGWVKAITQEGEGKKVQHRYLFCIEDPFELSHNVARTVTHHGIVAIRDEFRRAKRILDDVAMGNEPRQGNLLDEMIEETSTTQSDLSAAAGPGSATMQLTSQAQSGHQAQSQPLRGPSMRGHVYGHRGRGRGRGGPAPAPAPRPLDLTDGDAFPTLGGPKR